MPSPDVQHPAEIATPHDLLFTGSALGVASGMMPDTSWGRFGLNLARRPGVVAERVGSFGRELASIATGYIAIALRPSPTSDSAIQHGRAIR